VRALEHVKRFNDKVHGLYLNPYPYRMILAGLPPFGRLGRLTTNSSKSHYILEGRGRAGDSSGGFLDRRRRRKGKGNY